jgi:hypothetical protein
VSFIENAAILKAQAMVLHLTDVNSHTFAMEKPD